MVCVTPSTPGRVSGRRRTQRPCRHRGDDRLHVRSTSHHAIESGRYRVVPNTTLPQTFAAVCRMTNTATEISSPVRSPTSTYAEKYLTMMQKHRCYRSRRIVISTASRSGSASSDDETHSLMSSTGSSRRTPNHVGSSVGCQRDCNSDGDC